MTHKNKYHLFVQIIQLKYFDFFICLFRIQQNDFRFFRRGVTGDRYSPVLSIVLMLFFFFFFVGANEVQLIRLISLPVVDASDGRDKLLVDNCDEIESMELSNGARCCCCCLRLALMIN